MVVAVAVAVAVVVSNGGGSGGGGGSDVASRSSPHTPREESTRAGNTLATGNAPSALPLFYSTLLTATPVGMPETHIVDEAVPFASVARVVRGPESESCSESTRPNGMAVDSGVENTSSFSAMAPACAS